MTFLHILKSLDELLYEIMTWLIFYPVTLWRSVRHPLRTMQYALDQLARDDPKQFQETLRPPIFLLLTIILAHVVELALVGDSPVVASQIGAAQLIGDDRSLVIFRIVSFSVFPVVLAAVETSLNRQPINRDTLHAPFNAQCFLAAPYVLALSLADTGLRYPEWADLGVWIASGAATIAYLWAEAAWLMRSTRRGWRYAVLGAITGWLACMLILILVATLLGGA